MLMTEAIYPVLGNETSLPFYLSGIGVSDPEYHVKRDAGLISHQFLFTQGGQGILRIGGATYAQSKGSLIYLSPGIPHEYRSEGGNWTTSWLVFRGDSLPVLMAALGFPPFLLSQSRDIGPLQSLFTLLMASARNPFSGPNRSSVLLYDFILQSREILQNRSPLPQQAVLERVIHVMEARFAEDLTLEQLSSEAGVSPQHFCRLFKARMGMRPLEYLARRRIAEAKSLLSGSPESVASIGKTVGYGDPTYFGMVFKRYAGISPSEYRRMGHSLPI
jgi:AraC-like DNA-binding protein